MNSWQFAAVLSLSLAVSVLVVVTRKWHGRWTGDFQDSGVQKLHLGSPPRIGIVPLLSAVLLGVYFLSRSKMPHSGAASNLLAQIILYSLPVVLLGLADDVTKKVSPRIRLLGAAVAGSVAMALLGTSIGRGDIGWLDTLLTFAPLSVAFTLMMVCGFTNAMNIIDGLNGLASGMAVLMLVATGIVAARYGDLVVVEMCVVLGLALAGFLLVNFPRGLMFLGDGGAYFTGFVLVQIWLLLITRNPGISPWFVMAVAFLPTMETAFSMYRRRNRKRKGRRSAAMAADRLHLHSLVYRRWALHLLHVWPWAERWVANSAASLAMLLFAALPMGLAMVAPGHTYWNLAVIAASGLIFLAWFGSFVRFTWARRLRTDNASADVVNAS